MKKIRFMLFALTAMTAVSCVKDIVTENDTQFTPEKDMINMVFTADAEKENSTKAGLEGKSVVWADGDAIKVFASDNTNNNTGSELTETSVNGTSATFEGEVQKAESYYAIYPATAGVSLTTTTVNSEPVTAIEAAVPAEQSAVAGSFDPKAFLAAAMPGEEVTNFSFKNVGTLVKFQLEDAENVKYVTFSGNNNETLAGTGYITFDENETPTHRNVTNATASKVITLSSESWSVAKDYFMVIRPTSFANGITVAVHYQDGTIKYKASDKAITSDTGMRNKVLNLGTLNGLSDDTPNDLYVAWMHGYSLELTPGINYNKTQFQEPPTLVTNNTTNKTLSNGLYFIDPDVTGLSFGTINNSVIIGRYEDQRSQITQASSCMLSPTSESTDMFVLKNMKFTGPTNYMIGVNNGTFETVIINDCYLETASEKHVIYYTNANGQSKVLGDVFITECDCKMSTSGDLINAGNTTAVKSLTIGHNVIFADSEMTGFHIFNGGSVVMNSVDFSYNSLYKTTIGSNNFINTTSISSLNVSYNFLVECNATVNKYISSKVPTAYSIQSNAYVRKTGTSTNIYAYSSCDSSLNPISKNAPTNMLTRWDPANGNYGISGYYSETESYGATR